MNFNVRDLSNPDNKVTVTVSESLFGTSGNDTLTGTEANDTISGSSGDDSLIGGGGDDILIGGQDSVLSSGGRDTLEGGQGNDAYLFSLTVAGGSQVIEEQGDTDILLIFAEDTNVNPAPEAFADPATFGQSAISLSLPQEGIIGLEKSGNNLIIDLNRDGVAEPENDLTVVNFFNEAGNLGTGSIQLINNIVNSQEIVNFFNSDEQSISGVAGDSSGTNVYRFFNNNSGVHFYTADVAERDRIQDEIPSFSYEGASYRGVDPLTGGAVPVYRFLNESTGVHLYTVSETEREVVSDLDNFNFEGEAFFAYPSAVEGSIPIYRFFNSTTGAHFYTPSVEERNNLANNLPAFESEGIAYYALPNEIDS